mgnify:CR=1 FL=1
MNPTRNAAAHNINMNSSIHEPATVQESVQQTVQQLIQPQRVISILRTVNPAENRRIQDSDRMADTSLRQPPRNRVNFQDHIEVIQFSRKGYVTRIIRPHRSIVDKKAREKTELDKFFACVLFICCEFGNIEPYRRKFGI